MVHVELKVSPVITPRPFNPTILVDFFVVSHKAELLCGALGIVISDDWLDSPLRVFRHMLTTIPAKKKIHWSYLGAITSMEE